MMRNNLIKAHLGRGTSWYENINVHNANNIIRFIFTNIQLYAETFNIIIRE